MAVTVRTNRYRGNPGTNTFRYKLPKWITKESVSFAVNVIVCAHKTVPVGLGKSDFYLWGTHANISRVEHRTCRRFVLSGIACETAETDEEPEEPGRSSLHNSSIESHYIINPADQSVDNESHCQLCDLFGSPDEKICMRCKCLNNQICMRCKCLNNRMDELSKNVEKLQHAVEALLDTPQRQTPSEPHPPRARDSNNDEREGQRRTPLEPHPPRAQYNNGRAPPQGAATERRHRSMAPSRSSQPRSIRTDNIY